MTGKEYVDALAAKAVALLLDLVESVFGASVRAPLVGPFSWADLIVLLCLVALVAFVNGVTASFIRRQVRRAASQPTPREWRTRFFQAAGLPLYLLIWVYGIYFAASPVLLKLPESETPHPVRQLFDGLFQLGVFVAAFWLCFRYTRVIEARLQAWAAKSESKWDDVLAPLVGRSLRVFVPVIAVILVLPLFGLAAESSLFISKGSSLLIIGTVSWILFQAVGAGEKLVLSKYDITATDNLQARKVYTQVHVISKTLYVVIGVFSAASALMLFEEVRQFGTSILASAGVLGIIVGFAAQRTIANLFAGFQLAMTQPIRIDDVVIVEGEWGRIEEFTLTYVVVHIWDDRRLIVPLSHFIERPFQNWTRVSAELLGSVFVWVDFALPLEAIRKAVQQIVESSPLWDRRFWNLQVTDTTERAMQVRVLATSADSSKSWDLRCEIREKLIAFIQEHHARALPRIRAEFEPIPATPMPAR